MPSFSSDNHFLPVAISAQTFTQSFFTGAVAVFKPETIAVSGIEKIATCLAVMIIQPIHIRAAHACSERCGTLAETGDFKIRNGITFQD